jgi:hypothetical protein
VLARLALDPRLREIKDGGPRYGADYLARARLGQGAFRVLVTDAYQKRCAISGERTLPVLQAAHIQSYAAAGPHRVSNGLLLRSDLHILFDRGYVTVTPELRIEISRRIREEFANGREYYAYHGKTLAVMPSEARERPAAEFLRWHNELCFGRGGFGRRAAPRTLRPARWWSRPVAASRRRRHLRSCLQPHAPEIRLIYMSDPATGERRQVASPPLGEPVDAPPCPNPRLRGQLRNTQVIDLNTISSSPR